MAKAKKERVSRVTQEEAELTSQLEKLAAVKNPTDAQKEQRKTLRGKIAPLRFVRLAQQRVPRAVKAIQAIGKLTGSGYVHTEEQAEKILKVIDSAVDAVRNKLKGEAGETESKFTL